jgi:hypothetical protein
LLDHPEFQSEDDPPGTEDEESAGEGGKPPAGVTSVPCSPQPPPPPQAGTEPAKEPGKWKENLKLGIELVGLAAIITYTVFSILQWAQIRYTNRLTARALDSSDKALSETLTKMQGQIDVAQAANALSQQLVKGQYSAVVDLSFTTQPISLDSITPGIGATFINKSKTDATDFRASVTYSRVEIPSMKPIGKISTQKITQPRLVALTGSQGGYESATFANFDSSDFSQEVIDSIKAQKSSVRMDVEYSYNNGFGDRENYSVCDLYVYAPSTKSGTATYATWEDCRFGINIYRNYLKKAQQTK